MRDTASSVTWLFVPGDRPDRFAKAAAAGADQVIIDLEDAISPHAKDQARQAAAHWLTAGGQCWVRVNAPGTPWHDDDLSTLGGLPALRGIVVPKAEDASDLIELAARLAPGTDLIALVESARGILNAAALTNCEAVARLAFGAIDFALDIDADDTDDALLLARGTLVLASRAAGKPAPIDSVTTNLAPPAAAADARRARALGFGGKLLIHPAQVREAQEAFRPTDAQAEWARGVLDTAGQASNGAVGKDGHMLDRPVIDRARRIIDRTSGTHR
ncbi:HpcH/HpaI aldolase/citrate lyase family protein [Nonomuraea aurantiaca]|uniref:HpcH/HpaI aldolase/citrate lyase family protein n=1 Tax=Nonomuraea aurantiaca TaxID=2878562 RepID=UPI001CD9F1D9|nr:CoA ester lyase [Nonomuraea aurantiaca]MCA2230277.1 CoA ester lyase [Nonomuraea aurantiaca]